MQKLQIKEAFSKIFNGERFIHKALKKNKKHFMSLLLFKENESVNFIEKSDLPNLQSMQCEVVSTIAPYLGILLFFPYDLFKLANH